MSGAAHGSGGGLGDLKWFILVLFLLFLAWYVTGGPERFRERTPFMKPLPPLGNGEKYDAGTLFVDPIR